VAALPTIAGAIHRLRRRAFDAPSVARATRRRHVVVLGDSHSSVLAGWQPEGWRFSVTTVGGATASGATNPNSVTAALPTYQARLASLRPFQAIMVMLGEVDCGYIIWRRAQAGGGSVEASFEETLNRYAQFLRSVAARTATLYVMSVPLPTLPDDASGWGEVAQRRSDVQVPQRDRTALTQRFNARVQALCEAEGWYFVDATTAQADPATGLVRDDLLRHGEADHHLSDTGYRPLIEAALCPYVEHDRA
jgi:GDSL-like Lipase/Acylhydrolase family